MIYDHDHPLPDNVPDGTLSYYRQKLVGDGHLCIPGIGRTVCGKDVKRLLPHDAAYCPKCEKQRLAGREYVNGYIDWTWKVLLVKKSTYHDKALWLPAKEA